MKKRLSKKDSQVFVKKLKRFSSDKQRSISKQYITNSNGSITLLDYMLIYSIASSIFDSPDYSSNVDTSDFDSGDNSGSDSSSNFDSGDFGGCGECGE